MSYMSSSGFNRDYGLPSDYFREDLTNYRPRVSGMRQSFGPLDLSSYPSQSDVSSTTAYSQSNIGAGFNPTPYYEETSVGTSNSSSSRAYPETYLSSSSYDQSKESYNSIPAAHRGQSAYSGSPSVTPPAFSSGFEGYPRGSGTSSTSTPRVTNQPRTTSINRGGSDRREAPADKICDYCGTGFTRNERLRYHIQRVHLNVEPDHACDVPGCARAFRQKSDLLRHQRTVHKDRFQGRM